jgi:DNA-binding response OmpR family regulator
MGNNLPDSLVAIRHERGAAVTTTESATRPDAPLVILLVEDEMLIRELARTALEEAGFALLMAKEGDEAIVILEGAEGATIRGVITDVNLGSKADGWDVGKRARELHPEIPVVYITGDSANEWSANGVPNSILIPKPFAPAQIVTAVSQLLNTSPPPE